MSIVLDVQEQHSSNWGSKTFLGSPSTFIMTMANLGFKSQKCNNGLTLKILQLALLKFCCHSSGIEVMNSTALLVLFLLNLLLVGRQERLKRGEMVRRLRGIITQLDGELQLELSDPFYIFRNPLLNEKHGLSHLLSPPPPQEYLSGCMDEVGWSPSLYPHLYTPPSSSWSLHWTYRDSQLVNLPVSLLVEGDIIALRPGQEAFASLRGIKVCLCWNSIGTSIYCMS